MPSDTKTDTAQVTWHAFKRGFWILALIYVLGGIVPGYYAVTAKLPPSDALQTAEGHVVLKHVGKNGYMIGLRNAGDVAYFTCRPSAGMSHDTCSRELSMSTLPGYEGRQAKVWWFEQTIYPFITQKRLVRIEIEGKELVGYADTKSSNEFDASSTVWTLFGLLCFFALVIFGFYWEFRKVRRVKNGQEHR